MNSHTGDHKGEIKLEIDELINQDRVVIFSKESCPYCVDAKNVFEEIGQTYREVDLNTLSQPKEVQAILKEMTGASTVPRVFVDGKCIGGGSDTVQLFKTGRLEEILKSESVPLGESGRGENPRF
ncbi:glutaredoxin [Folsomia candida]|uniref:Glutaredoxin-2, mitochondrial n=1 Tax=Folsomia candida TaxID=158441 RepID=A0A226EVC0_FOLCA|nr:glutaredoxin [Folsomia candida]OXA61034.1 Glutaredoxin-2, mitochondrial [Folsomia candida]